jgi:hypothetical protein
MHKWYNILRCKSIREDTALANLLVDLGERKAYNFPHLHTWVITHAAEIVFAFRSSIQREPLIPPGAPLDYIPRRVTSSSEESPADVKP